MDLAAALDACADLFTRHGGHAGAAGFELPAERWHAFVERFEAIAAAAVPPDPRAVLAIDLAVPALGGRLRLASASSPALAPYGPGNPEPLVAVLGLDRDPGPRRGRRTTPADAAHAISTCSTGSRSGAPISRRLVHEGDGIDVVARLASRTFGGFESLQLEIRDAAPSGSHPEAAAVLRVRRPPLLAGAVP